MVSTEAQPQVFSTFSCCPRLSSEKLFLKTTKHTGPPASFYLLAFSNVSFCHRSGPCALRVSGRVDSWYAGVREKRSWMFSLTDSGTAARLPRWVVSSCPQPSAANWNLFWYLDGDFATSLTLLCVYVGREIWIHWYTPHLIQWNGLTSQGSCLAASHAGVIVNVSQTCFCFFLFLFFHSWRSVRCGRVTLKLAEGMNCLETDVLCEVTRGC